MKSTKPLPVEPLKFINSVDGVIARSNLMAAQLAAVGGDKKRARKYLADTLRFVRKLKRDGTYVD